MPSDTLLKSIRRWLMVVALFLALLVYLVASTTTGVYLDNLIRFLSGITALAIGLVLVYSLTIESIETLSRRISSS